MASHLIERSRALLKSSASCFTIIACGVLPIVSFASPSLANPMAGAVTTGSASITSTSQRQTTIDQKSEDVVIDWSSFNIGSGQTTQFVQPNAQAIAVNRIGGRNASQIMGTLDANGRVVLINGNGMLFGTGAQVNVGSLIATSTNDTDSNVLAGKFSQAGNPNAAVVNLGSIHVAQGGLVALVAPNVTNAGTVSAKFGTVALGAANKFTVDLTGDGLVSFAAQGDVDGKATAMNTGLLAGTNVSLTAHAAEAIATGIVNMTGVIVAQTAHQVGGTILLDAGDGSLAMSGELNAAGQTGGGNIETSGNQVAISGTVTAGRNGQWKVDPYDLTVDSAAATTIDATLNSGTGVTLQTTATGTSGPGNPNSSGNGDIYIASALSWNSTARLTLDAYHSIFIDAPIKASHGGSLAMLTNDGGTGGDLFFLAGNVTFGNSASELSINGTSYALVYNIATLAADITSAPSGDYALAQGYNAKSDGTYASSPVSTAFSGTFEGLGNIISNLTIDDTTDTDVGLFASTISGAMVRDIVLTHAVVTGDAVNASVGGLIGTMAAGSSVEGASSSGTITMNSAFCRSCTFSAGVGGLVGSSAGAIEDSSSSANVWSQGQFDNTGGLIGTDTGTIANSYATGKVGGSDDPRIGGLAGVDNATTTDGSYATGAVSGSGTNVSIGGFAGQAYGLIENSFASGNVSAGAISTAGGLVGLEGGGQIENSYATGNVRGAQVGGLVGDEQGGTLISDSYATGTVTGGYGATAGGLVGEVYQQCNITGSHATGTVIVGNGEGVSDDLFDAAGGLVGFYNAGTITGSYAEGAVIGGAYVSVGGLVGGNNGTIDSSYAIGDVKGGKSSTVGGLAGLGNIIKNSYATGSVTGGTDSTDGGLIGDEPYNVYYSYSTGTVRGGSGSLVGGLVGNSRDMVFLDDYWDMTASGITNPSQGAGNVSNQRNITGLTTAQFQSGLPAGLDPTIWGESSSINGGLPYLLAAPPS